MLIQSITDFIGNTPLLKISSEIHGLKNIELYSKLELFNPWGSLKDRTALGIMQPHLNKLDKKSIIESSSGNLAKSLQIIALMHKSKLKTISNRIKVPEVKDILKLIGVEIEELPGKSDCYDPNDPNDPIIYIQREIAKNKNKYIYSDQYFNDLNRKIHYDTTGKEILNDLGSVDYVIGGLGTTGSTLGVAQRIKKNNPELIVIGVVAEENDYIPGIRSYDEMLEVGLFKPKFYDDIISVNSHNSLKYMMLLIKQAGLLAGPTTGASFCGVINYFKKIDKTLTSPKKVVFIACDRVEWYISYIKDRMPHWFGDLASVNWKDGLKITTSVDISISESSVWIKKENPLIVDLRQPISFKITRIPGSINLPFDHLDSILNTANPFQIKQKILFICSVGQKSALVASYLRKQKVKAFNLQGGINSWRAKGLPVKNNL